MASKRLSDPMIPIVIGFLVSEPFSLGQLTLPLWQVTLICFIESMRQINDPKFDQALQRLESNLKQGY